jgi:hypothetical protein
MLRTDAEFADDTRAQILDQNVSIAHKGLELLDVGGIFHVESHRALVAVGDMEHDGGSSMNGGPQLRASSPPSGFSILITSAPMSAMIAPASGPASACPISMTLIPASGPCIALHPHD